MSADRNLQGFGIRPEDQTPAQQVYRYHHQRQIQERMKAQEEGRTETPPVNVANYVAKLRQKQSPDNESYLHHNARFNRNDENIPDVPSRRKAKRHHSQGPYPRGHRASRVH